MEIILGIFSSRRNQYRIVRGTSFLDYRDSLNLSFCSLKVNVTGTFSRLKLSSSTATKTFINPKHDSAFQSGHNMQPSYASSYIFDWHDWKQILSRLYLIRSTETHSGQPPRQSIRRDDSDLIHSD